LASEEAIKADVLYKISLNPEWLKKEYSNLNKLFSNHSYKHEKSNKEEQIGHIFSNLFDAFSTTVERLDQIENEAEVEKEIEKIEKNYKRSLVGIRKKIRQDNVNKDWWQNANTDKNLGFYVNIAKDENTWIGPFDINEENFNRSLHIDSAFVDKIQRAIS
jgi:hypothetical protein